VRRADKVLERCCSDHLGMYLLGDANSGVVLGANHEGHDNVSLTIDMLNVAYSLIHRYIKRECEVSFSKLYMYEKYEQVISPLMNCGSSRNPKSSQVKT